MARHVLSAVRGKRGALWSALAGLALLLGTTGSAAPQGKNTGAYLAEAAGRVTQHAADVKGYGYSDGISILGGWVESSQSLEFDLSLAGNVDYMVLAGGDNDAEDVDLEVRDRNGKSLALDDRTAADAVIRFRPSAAGTYTLRLTLFKAKNNFPCVCMATVLKKGGWEVPLGNLDTALGAMIRELASSDADLQKTGKRLDLHKGKNEWALFGAIQRKGDDSKVTGIKLGNGQRAFFAAGDNNAKDVDLFLLDSQGREIAKDDKTDKTAVIVHTPQGQGTHGLRMLNYDSTGPALVVMSIFDILN